LSARALRVAERRSRLVALEGASVFHPEAGFALQGISLTR
jgi:hypothetical protein